MHSCLFALNPEHEGFRVGRMSGKITDWTDARSQVVIDVDAEDGEEDEDAEEGGDVTADKSMGEDEVDEGGLTAAQRKAGHV